MRLVSELADIVSTASEISSQIQSEVNAAIEGCNQKIDELNAAKAAINQLPVTQLNKLRTKAFARYDSYIAEINLQKAKLEQSLGCLA